jgi:hypothetical protein
MLSDTQKRNSIVRQTIVAIKPLPLRPPGFSTDWRRYRELTTAAVAGIPNALQENWTILSAFRASPDLNAARTRHRTCEASATRINKDEFPIRNKLMTSLLARCSTSKSSIP